MTRLIPAALAAVFVLSGGVSPRLARAAEPFDGLLKGVPPATNTLALIDVKGAFASPLAKAEKWADAKAAGRTGFGFIPHDAEAVVVAAAVNLSAMTRDHQVGLVRVRNTPTMNQLAAREGGVVDDVAGRLVVLSPRDVYFTTLSATELVAVYPADRQATARWIRFATGKTSAELSPVLRQAAGKAGDATVTIAVDLTDVAAPSALRAGLQVSPVMVKHKGANISALARFISRTKGLTFTAKVTDAIAGTIRVDFESDPSFFRATLRDLFLELIDSQGVRIDGLDRWETTFGPDSMTLAGPLATADLRRIVSLFAFPGVTSADDPQPGKDETSVPATQRYMAAVQAILADIRATRESPNFEKTATWHDKAAAQIEHLSRRGVDPLAADAAFESSKRLRAIAGSLRGVPIDVEALSQKAYIMPVPFPRFGGWWGVRGLALGPPGVVDTNIPQVQAEMARVIADDQKRRLDTWGQIDRILSDARRKLTDKYKTGF
jgi:hypothetical protein